MNSIKYNILLLAASLLFFMACTKENAEPIYPNPTGSLLNLKLDFVQNENIQVNVLNVVEQTVMEQLMNATNEELSLNVNALSPGIYVLNILDGSKLYTSKFVKE